MAHVRIAAIVALGLGLVGGMSTRALAQANPPANLVERVAALEAKVAALEALPAKVRLVEGEINGVAGPHLIIEGANLHLRSGSGATDDTPDGTIGNVSTPPVGLGNLIIGYNETFSRVLPGDRAARTMSSSVRSTAIRAWEASSPLGGTR
jgi:hypothetical protein